MMIGDGRQYTPDMMWISPVTLLLHALSGLQPIKTRLRMNPATTPVER